MCFRARACLSAVDHGPPPLVKGQIPHLRTGGTGYGMTTSAPNSLGDSRWGGGGMRGQVGDYGPIINCRAHKDVINFCGRVVGELAGTAKKGGKASGGREGWVSIGHLPVACEKLLLYGIRYLLRFRLTWRKEGSW